MIENRNKVRIKKFQQQKCKNLTYAPDFADFWAHVQPICSQPGAPES